MSEKPKDTNPNTIIINMFLQKDSDGISIGKNPLDMDISELKAGGHEDIPLAKTIRKKCLDCAGFQHAEVRKCVAFKCPLWPHRMGKNPFLADKRKS